MGCHTEGYLVRGSVSERKNKAEAWIGVLPRCDELTVPVDCGAEWHGVVDQNSHLVALVHAEIWCWDLAIGVDCLTGDTRNIAILPCQVESEIHDAGRGELDEA